MKQESDHFYPTNFVHDSLNRIRRGENSLDSLDTQFTDILFIPCREPCCSSSGLYHYTLLSVCTYIVSEYSVCIFLLVFLPRFHGQTKKELEKQGEKSTNAWQMLFRTDWKGRRRVSRFHLTLLSSHPLMCGIIGGTDTRPGEGKEWQKRSRRGSKAREEKRDSLSRFSVKIVLPLKTVLFIAYSLDCLSYTLPSFTFVEAHPVPQRIPNKNAKNWLLLNFCVE